MARNMIACMQAQQAIAWASAPQGFKSPYTLITGIPEDLEDCPSSYYQAVS